MTPKVRIDELFAYVAVDEEGEGITAYLSADTGQWMPMVGADMERMTSLLPVAQQLADKGARPIKLVHYTTRTVIDTIEPRERPAEELEHLVDVAELQTPEAPAEGDQDDEDLIFAQDVIVVGLLTRRGPGIAISYLSDGYPTLPLCVTGELADELVRLVTEAQTAIKRIEN